MAWTSQWPPSGRPVAAQWPPQWPPSGRPQIMVFLIKYALKKEKARVQCILYLNQNIQKTILFVGGHWAATGAATGRPLGGHWAATVRWQLKPSEYQWKHTITEGRGQLSECAGACKEAPVLGSCTRQFTNSLLPHAKRDFPFFCTLYKAI